MLLGLTDCRYGGKGVKGECLVFWVKLVKYVLDS